jgi:hypothetical protein
MILWCSVSEIRFKSSMPRVYAHAREMISVVDKDGLVYQKDLGPNTASLAKAMTSYNPDKTWQRVE